MEILIVAYALFSLGIIMEGTLFRDPPRELSFWIIPLAFAWPLIAGVAFGEQIFDGLEKRHKKARH